MRINTLAIALAASLAAGAASPARADTPTPLASLDQVKTIVVIYAENHSFEQYFGNFPGANGLANATAAAKTQLDRNGQPLSALPSVPGNGLTDPSDPTQIPTSATVGLANGPFSLEEQFGVNFNYKLHDMYHRFYENQMQIDGGKNDKFAAWADSGGEVMGYWNGSSLALWSLAKQYTLTDNWFQGAFGGSFLNHQYLICACAPYDFKTAADPVTFASNVSAVNADGVSLQLDPASPASALDGVPKFVRSSVLTPDYFGVNTMQPPYAPTGNPDPNKPGYGDLTKGGTLSPQGATTIGDLLTQAGVDWAWYSGAMQAVLDGTAPANVLYQFHHQPFNYYQAYAPGTAARTAHLKDGGLAGAAFIADIDAGKLPAVTFYKPQGNLNQHPGYATPADGDAHITEVIQHLQASPQWNNMVVIVTFDENGGQWDHVAPPKADRFGPGSRVPAVIVSPFAKRGFVDHTQYDTASILRFITRRFDLPKLSGLQQRDAALVAKGEPPMGDLTAALDLVPTIDANFTGSWDDPSQSGQGFNLEVLGDQLLAYWYVFDDAGNQAWIFGVGPINGNQAKLTATIATHGKFPPHFVAGDIKLQQWGTLNFSFDSCSSGSVSWTTSLAGFGTGSGSQPLAKFTQPSGLSCQ